MGSNPTLSAMKVYFKSFYLFLFFSIAYLILGISITNTVNAKEIFKLDFRSFYTSALMIQHGISENFYNFNTQFYFQKSIFNLPNSQFLMPFLNPPYVAAIYYPFIFLSLKNAYFVFSILNIFISLISFYTLLSELYKKESNLSKYSLSLLFLLLFFPVWVTIVQTQVSFFLLLSLVGSWYFLKHKKTIASGICLSLLFIKPHLVILPLFFLIVKKQWEVIFGCFIAGLMLSIISFLIVGYSGLINYLQVLVKMLFVGSSFAIHPQLEPTLRGFLQYIFQTSEILKIYIPLATGILIIISFLLFFTKGRLNSNSRTFDYQWGLLIVSVILTSLHTNYHDLVLLLFPILLILKSITKVQLVYLFVTAIDFIFLAFAFTPFLLFPIIAIIFLILMYITKAQNLPDSPRNISLASTNLQKIRKK